jgi:hypothetical protein
VPDDALNAAADANMLTTKEQILAQAQRMIKDRAKVSGLVAGFHRDWLGMNMSMSHWFKIDHDPAKFPLYNAAAKLIYAAEMDRFFEEVAFAGGSFKDLFLSPVAFVNRDNAAIYGLDPAAYGTDLVRVELDRNQRPGFMTRIGFLQSYSSYDTTSPILRGAFITAHMIGLDPGPPNVDPSTVMKPMGPFSTQRAMVEKLTEPQECTGCHSAFINPPGFVLERYDAIGKWQDVDPLGGPINGTADVYFNASDPKTITSPLELMTEISVGATAKAMYAKNWVTYTTGRAPNPNDACLSDQINAKLANDGYTVLNLLADLTQADSFRLRVREN